VGRKTKQKHSRYNIMMMAMMESMCPPEWAGARRPILGPSDHMELPLPYCTSGDSPTADGEWVRVMFTHSSHLGAVRVRCLSYAGSDMRKLVGKSIPYDTAPKEYTFAKFKCTSTPIKQWAKEPVIKLEERCRSIATG